MAAVPWPVDRFSEVVTRLEAALARPLPGAAAHAFVEPLPRPEWPKGFDPSRVRHAAGLLLALPVNDRAHVLLTVRGHTLGRHRGQVSLPGGAIEPGETVEQAALREAREEVALPSEEVRVLGALTPLDIPVSGFRLHPVVGTLGAPPALVAADGEVARIVLVPIAELARPGSVVAVERTRDGRPIVVPAFRAVGEEIWGATAMVLAEFLALLGWRGTV
jgi:8-oxo-dGTP pyrophosphatase MutT (NUDIX family)